CAFRIN
ncbi:hypothetical protein D049_0660B, partial [Vibrio parahaemolyticus VPTS-2010]